MQCMVPENTLPVCVSVVFRIIALVRPAPIIDPLESEALPSQAPLIVLVALGLVGDDMPLPLQADGRQPHVHAHRGWDHRVR